MTVHYDEGRELGLISRGVVQCEIQFQHGMDPAPEVPGVTNEEVIFLLVLRLRHLNEVLPCRENSLAITKLQEAGFWLDRRTALRRAQGVESTPKAHES